MFDEHETKSFVALTRFLYDFSLTLGKEIYEILWGLQFQAWMMQTPSLEKNICVFKLEL